MKGLKGQGRAAGAWRPVSKVLLLEALECTVDIGLVESEATEKLHLWERVVWIPFLPVLLTSLFPCHCLLGALGISLAIGNNTWPSGFQQYNGYSSSSNEFLDSGDSYFPEPTTSVRESGLPTWTDSLKKKKGKKEKKEKKKSDRLYLKNNRKAISCDNLLPLTKVIQERDWSVISFLESRVLSSNL